MKPSDRGLFLLRHPRQMRARSWVLALCVILPSCESPRGDGGSRGDTETSPSTESGSGADGDTSSGGADTGDTTAGDGLAGSCTGPGGPFSVQEAITVGEHPCAPWLEAVRGRAGKNGSGSFALWSVRTQSGVGLMVSANHVLGEGWFAQGGEPATRTLQFIDTEGGIGRLSLPPADGNIDESWGLSPLFRLFNSAIPADQTGDGLAHVVPRHDYFVGVVDGQRVHPSGGAFPIPGPLQLAPLPLYDPLALAAGAPTWGEARAGDRVLLVGYPQGEHADLGGYSVGIVLDEPEIEDVLAVLARQGDEEGDIAYDVDAEFIVHASASVGMSGGPVFDEYGRLLGIMVRATLDEPRIVRVVRMSWIVGDLEV